MTSDLVSLFLDAVRVDALSLHERPMAEFVRRTLAGLPFDIHEDDTASSFGGECGNLFCVPRHFDRKRPAIALLAHMDTPRSTANVRPVVAADRITSDGTTALGVDNRAGVAALLQTMRTHPWKNDQENVIVVFSVAEEVGPFGSKYIDLTPYNVKMCFVFDCSKRPGTYIQAAVGCSLYTASFIGKSAHAAVAPEKGVSAIHMAAEALGSIPRGRLSPTMTTNVGTISGGVATNVVPDRCTVQGEVREFARAPIEAHIRMIEDRFRTVAASHSGSIEFSSSEDFAPFRLGSDDLVVSVMNDVLISLGLTPHPIEYLGGSDANMLNGKGIPAVNLGIGAQNPHGDDEFILLEDLHMTAAIAEQLIKRSGIRS